MARPILGGVESGHEPQGQQGPLLWRETAKRDREKSSVRASNPESSWPVVVSTWEISATRCRRRRRISWRASLAATLMSQDRRRLGSRTEPSFRQANGHADCTASWDSSTSPQMTNAMRDMSSWWRATILGEGVGVSGRGLGHGRRHCR